MIYFKYCTIEIIFEIVYKNQLNTTANDIIKKKTFVYPY